MLNGVQQWQLSGKRFPGLGGIGVGRCYNLFSIVERMIYRRILIDANSSMCFVLATKGRVQADTIDENGRFQKAWCCSDVRASALSDAVIRHNGESIVAVAELNRDRLVAQSGAFWLF